MNCFAMARFVIRITEAAAPVAEVGGYDED